MKRCPKCNGTYTDDDLNYCLVDGTGLTIESEQITVERTDEKKIVLQSQPARRKGKLLLWLGLSGLVILVVGGVIAGLLIYKYSGQGESVRGERQNGVHPPTSPALQTTPRVSPTPAPADNPTVAGPYPKPEESKPISNTPENDDAEEITPIRWDTTPSGFKGEDGKIFKFRCPEKGTESIVWGSDVYTQDSSICTAAVHVGRITLAHGGVVTIEFRPGRSMYGSTVRNGITSKTYGEYPHSFVVR